MNDDLDPAACVHNERETAWILDQTLWVIFML